VHKSFREYLFAEGIVETLKQYARRHKSQVPNRDPYWREFSDSTPNDIRFNLSRELAELLAPQWLRPEVTGHLEQLILWEVGRIDKGDPSKPIGMPTEGLQLEEWRQTRDGIADIWDWWAEGAHLRPQPKMDKRTRNVDFEKVYVQDLVELCAPHDPSQRAKQLEPARVVAMDSHLGDGIFMLCALLHYHIAVNTGWLKGRD
jgi:hypothetical protein